MLDGLKEMFTRTQFVSDQGGYFPEIKAHPEHFIMKRRPEFRDWLKMLRQNGKFLYVITGSHVDFASHVASYALGEDWSVASMTFMPNILPPGRIFLTLLYSLLGNHPSLLIDDRFGNWKQKNR